MTVQEAYGKYSWCIQVYSIVWVVAGKRWRMSYDDDFIAEFDHEPTMSECMDALIKWWNRTCE
jgi:hypothetical protein